MSMIRLEKVSKFYKSEDTVSVGMKDIDLEFDLGEFVVVTGESGSGKSTLLNVISGLDGYENGEMYLFGEETSHYIISDWEKYRGAYVGFVFQNYNIIDSYTVYQNVLLALEIQEYEPAKRKERALQLIEQVGLTSHKHHRASKLSGGQKQRVVIARALAKDCPIIAADEPTGNLDSETGKQIMKLLHEISKDKLVILVTHDYEQAEKYATRKIKMHDGEVVEDKIIKSTEKVNIKQVEPQKMKFSTMIQIALRNFIATPKRLIFMLLLQIIAAAVFVIVYSSLIAGIKETGLRQSSRYPTVPETRLLVEKRDGSEFSDQDLETLQKMRYIEKVHKHAENFYNNINLTVYINAYNEYSYRHQYYVKATDTAAALSKNDIDGRIPTAKDEIVFSSYFDDIKIGSKVTIAFADYFYSKFDEEQTVEIGTFTVVGIDKLNRSTIYFSEEFLNMTPSQMAYIDYRAYQDNLFYMFDNLEMTDQYNNVYKFGGEDMFDTDIFVSSFMEPIPATIEINLSTRTLYGEEIKMNFEDISFLGPKIDGLEHPLFEYAYLGQDFYHQILDTFKEKTIDYYQIDKQHLVSISVNGYYEGSKILKNINSDIFKVYYPSYIFEPMRELLVFLQTLLAILVIFLIVVLLAFVIQIVTKNIMRGRKKDFAIFRSIGANKYILARLVVFEQILLSIAAFIITLICLFFLKFYIYNISKTISYIGFFDYLILLAILIILGMRIGLKFNRKVFNQSVIETLSESRED